MKIRFLSCGIALAVSLTAFFPLSEKKHDVTFEDYQGSSCQGCERRAVLTSALNTGNRSMVSYLAEYATTPCFHLMNMDAVIRYEEQLKKEGLTPGGQLFREPEYYFTVSYDETPDETIKSRFNIKLFFYTDELVYEWETTSERPTFTFNGHLNRMFRNPTAAFRQTVPIDVQILNEFEKRPYKCDIRPTREKVLPGEEIEVTISNIRDIQGEKSREFNRIIVQAVNGEIKGGTAIDLDPSLKAFPVGTGEITFTYQAPGGSPGEIVKEDNIIIYNSCEIQDPSKVPLEKTIPKDKIAEKAVEIEKKKLMLVINFSSMRKNEYKTKSSVSRGNANYSGTVRFDLKEPSVSTSDDEIQYIYEASQCTFSGFSGQSSGEARSWTSSGATRTEKTRCSLNLCSYNCPESAAVITFSKDGTVKNVELGGFGLEVCLTGKIMIKDYDGKEYIQSIPFASMEKMSIPETFIFDPKTNMGVFRISGTDQGNMRSGVITGNRIIKSGDEYFTATKKATYWLFL